MTRRTTAFALTSCLVLAGCGPTLIRPDPSMRRADYPDRFDVRDFAVVVRENVRDNLVDYQHLKAHPDALERFLAYVSEVGPLSKPNQFRTPQERTAYWINAYNAAALRFVLQQYPTDTVYPLVGPSFEYDFAFPVDGRPMTLHDIEVRAFRDSREDVRVLFALCAAARGCPPLQNEPFYGADLPRRMALTARLAMANRNLVRRDDSAQMLLVWWPMLARRDEFIRFYERRNATHGATLLNVLLDFSGQQERLFLQSAIDYDIGAISFDRRLNDTNLPSKVEKQAGS